MKQRKFRLGGAEWKLRWKKSLNIIGPDGTTWGETHPVDRLVFLSKKELAGKPDLAARVALHEIFHAALHMGGATEMLSSKTEESVVCCLENLLFESFWDGSLLTLLTKVAEDAAKGES